MYECYILLLLEFYSDVEIDRFDISIGSFLWILENVEMDKDVNEKLVDYEDFDFGFIDVVIGFFVLK